MINDSTDATEKYNLKASDALGDVPWNLIAGDTTGTDTYSLRAMFNSTRPSEADFTTLGTDGELTNANQTCDGVIFLGDEDGYNTPAGTQELLWFRIRTPVSVGSSEEKTTYITITAFNQG